MRIEFVLDTDGAKFAQGRRCLGQDTIYRRTKFIATTSSSIIINIYQAQKKKQTYEERFGHI